MPALIHFAKLSVAYLVRPGGHRKLATVWAYLKVTLVDHLGLRRDHVSIVGWEVSFPSSRSLRQLFEEIFLGEHYRLDNMSNAAPFIIDGGANIGLATLYFKLRHPDARIVCFEPHPTSFAYLKTNLAANGIDVEAHQLALGAGDGEAPLFGVNLGASLDVRRGEEVSGHTEQSVTVPVRALSEFIADRDVDVLKLDIEGYEGVVLSELDDCLRRVREVVFEYHRWPDSAPLSRVLATLEANGHDYDVKFWRREGTVATCTVRTWRVGSPA